MTDPIEKVTLENAAEQLKAKIRMAFVELLPEEQWKEMVATELKRFTQESAERDWQGNHKRVPSAFEAICREVFSDYAKSEIKTYLTSAEWQGKWGHDGHEQISEAVKGWCTEHSKALIESTLLVLAGGAAQQLVNGIRNL